MILFVTVGTTRFDALINAINNNEEMIAFLISKKFTKLIIQHGNSSILKVFNDKIDIEYIQYTNDMSSIINISSLVIGKKTLFIFNRACWCWNFNGSFKSQ